uniref:Osiris 5, isoform B n=1 Tax=Drosophila melanogaster TaxID=7227 RepID=A0A0B4JD67_DROME|nr:osiris 5, isoform B [Drosophila melanogaster]ADV37274.1 osiris 5, isoform B [Drosophila melanogaster]|eukprot:NP_001189183.1 osiris 5, isoform B [Drosophila melanogaster]
MFRTFPLLCLLFLTAVRSENCDQDAGATLYCRGERALRNVLRNLNRSDKPLVVIRGLEIVPLQNNSISDEEPDQEQGLLDSLSFYLRTHEINVKLADLLEDESQVSARKKDKGQGMLLAMALMFGKMMAVMGLGGIAALAMKALGVSLVALMMAGMLGLKTAAQHGGESSHSISYVTGEGHHHKRRRRSSGQQPLAYRGWD